MPDFPKIGGATAAEVAAAILVDPATDKINGSNVDATVSSRGTSTLTQAQIISDSTPFLGASVATIKGKTDIIGGSVALESAGNLATVMGKTNLIGASVALETGGNVASVKAKTDLIPADITTQLDTNIPAIQAKAAKIQDFLEEGTGTLTADGTEQILRAYVGLGKLHCYIDLTNMVSGNSVTIRQYMTIKTAGSYRLYAQETYTDVQTLPLLHITMKPGKFGVKVTLQQAAVVYKTYDWETLVEQAAA